MSVEGFHDDCRFITVNQQFGFILAPHKGLLSPDGVRDLLCGRGDDCGIRIIQVLHAGAADIEFKPSDFTGTK